MTRGYKRSPVCSNCGRDKRVVTPTLNELSNWLTTPWCEECAHKQCRDITRYEPCSNRRMVVDPGAHPAVYRDYCAKHWPIYAFCPNRKCRNMKEVWMPVCWECHAKTEASRLKKLHLMQRKAEVLQEKAAKAVRAKQRRRAYRNRPLPLPKELKQ